MCRFLEVCERLYVGYMKPFCHLFKIGHLNVHRFGIQGAFWIPSPVNIERKLRLYQSVSWRELTVQGLVKRLEGKRSQWSGTKQGQENPGRSRSWKLLSLMPARTMGKMVSPGFHARDGRDGGVLETLSPHCLAPLATALSWLSRSSLVDTVYSAWPHTEIRTGKAENGWGRPEQVKTSAQCDGPSGLRVPVDSWNQS